jgi:hypothetical protein
MSDLTDKQIHDYQKAGLRRERVEAIRSRAIDPSNGRVYTGEAGKNLLRRQQEEIQYKERSGK